MGAEVSTARGRLVVALAGAMAVLFVVGMGVMFQWRFRSGDVYLPGSSMRADPLGGRVLYESLREIPRLEVVRNFETYRRLEGGHGRALLLIGARRDFLDGWQATPELEALHRFADSGGRVAIAMTPERLSAFEEEERKKEREEAQEDGEDSDKDKDKAEAHINLSSLVEEWGFSFEWRSGKKPAGGWKVRRTGKLTELSDRDLPPWHSSIFLENLGPEWEVLARVEKGPVLARLEIGKGEVLLATDAYFASNEALVSQRFPRFLAWFAGANDVLIFDETHLGSERRLNVMQLVRRFRLHGFFVGLGLFVVLLAWRSSSSLLPGDDELGMGISTGHEVSGQDSAAGFRRLLRRSVGKGELLETCFKAWCDQRGRLPRPSSDGQLDRARAVIAREREGSPRKAHPVAAYNEISAILAERN